MIFDIGNYFKCTNRVFNSIFDVLCVWKLHEDITIGIGILQSHG